MLRPVGIGILIGGALAGVIAAFPAIRAAVKTLSSATRMAGTGGADELSARTLGFGLLGAFGLLYAASALIVGPMLAIPVALAGSLWLALAGLIVAQATGMTDISPLSGMALIGVTLMLAITGGEAAAAVLVGVAVCVGVGQCADMMQDLKTGHLVGGIPRRQQLAQIFTGWLGPMVAVGTVYLLWHRYGVDANGVVIPGFGPESAACQAKAQGLAGAADCLSAPQAEALKGMVEGVINGNAPVDKYFAGGLVGLALGALPIAGLGVLVGLAMYLPFEITLGYGVGCLAGWYLEAKKGRSFFSDKVVPLAAGFIVGEALTALVVTAIAVASPELAKETYPGLILLVIFVALPFGLTLGFKPVGRFVLLACGVGTAAFAGAQLVDAETAKIAAWASQSGLVFGIGIVAIVLAAVLMRLAAAETSAESAESDVELGSIGMHLEALRSGVDRALALVKGDAPVHDVCRHLDGLREEHVFAITNQRNRLVSERGMMGYAELVSPLSAAERNINRAWSTLVDGYPHEAQVALERARVSLMGLA
jgi:hypothetical protein